jgi:hypothetical protein
MMETPRRFGLWIVMCEARQSAATPCKAAQLARAKKNRRVGDSVMKLTEFSKIPASVPETAGDQTPATLTVANGKVVISFEMAAASVRTSKKNQEYHFLTLVFSSVPAPFSRRSLNLPL